MRCRTLKSSRYDAHAPAAVAIRGLAGDGLNAGPHTIAWQLEHHQQVAVSPARISRYLSRHGLVWLDRARTRCTLRFP
jgi:hypothetical protein